MFPGLPKVNLAKIHDTQPVLQPVSVWFTERGASNREMWFAVHDGKCRSQSECDCIGDNCWVTFQSFATWPLQLSQHHFDTFPPLNAIF